MGLYLRVRKYVISMNASIARVALRSGWVGGRDRVHVIISFCNYIGAHNEHINIFRKIYSRVHSHKQPFDATFCRLCDHASLGSYSLSKRFLFTCIKRNTSHTYTHTNHKRQLLHSRHTNTQRRRTHRGAISMQAKKAFSTS